MYDGISEKRNDAFLFLYNNHINAIINMVKKNSGEEEDAMDIFQEGMIALWVNIKKGKYTLDGNTKVSTYLYSVCRNLWLKKLRSSKKIVSLDQQEKEYATEPVELDDNYEKIKKLETLFTQLGDKCRTILHEFYYEKASMKDIALKFNYEEKTAKNEKYRCMQRLRAMYN